MVLSTAVSLGGSVEDRKQISSALYRSFLPRWLGLRKKLSHTGIKINVETQLVYPVQHRPIIPNTGLD